MDISSLALWWNGSWSHLMLSSCLPENQKTIMKYWAPEGVHVHCLANMRTCLYPEWYGRGGNIKPHFPLVFKKDGLIWQPKPHSHQWATREGSQQPHVVTSCRCCRKSDRGHFHHAITTSRSEPARRKTFPSILLSFLSSGWAHGDFFVCLFLFSEVSTPLTFIEVSIFLSIHFNSLLGISLLLHLPLSHYWIRSSGGKVGRDTWF